MELSGIWKVLSSIPDRQKEGKGGRKGEKKERK